QPFPVREFQEATTRRIASTVRTSLPMDPIAKLPDNIQTSIRRAIVNHDDFLIGPCLGQGAFDRLADPLFGVVAGDQDRNERAHGYIRSGRGSIGSKVEVRFRRKPKRSGYCKRSMSSVTCQPS